MKKEIQSKDGFKLIETLLNLKKIKIGLYERNNEYYSIIERDGKIYKSAIDFNKDLDLGCNHNKTVNKALYALESLLDIDDNEKDEMILKKLNEINYKSIDKFLIVSYIDTDFLKYEDNIFLDFDKYFLNVNGRVFEIKENYKSFNVMKEKLDNFKEYFIQYDD